MSFPMLFHTFYLNVATLSETLTVLLFEHSHLAVNKENPHSGLRLEKVSPHLKTNLVD